MGAEPTLNKEQRRAVEHREGPMLVVAGAGTGKTRVITERVAWLVEQGLAKPEEILALTFTEKAAGEMLDRLDDLLGWRAYRAGVMTFHAFGAQLITQYAHHMGRGVRSELLPVSAKPVLLRRYLEESELNYYPPQDDQLDFLAGQLGFIELLQNADVSPADYRRYIEGLQVDDENLHALDIAEARDQLAIYELYERIKRKHGVIDYHDQIKLPLEMLQKKPNIAARLHRQYRYVLVDEYQDTNAVQEALLRAFIPKGGNIFAVGDDDQAVYGFRGARLSNILEFSDYYGVKRPIVLTQNYRSTQAILDSAYRLIQGNNPDRLEAQLKLDKRLRSRSTGPKPQFRGFATPTAEREGIAERLAAELKAGTEPAALAVLAPTHAALRAMAKVLKSRDLPFALSSSVNIFEQPELLQLWHLLRWLALEAEEKAIVNLLAGSFVGLTYSQISTITTVARRELVSIEESLRSQAGATKDVRKAVKKLDEWREWTQQLPVSQLAYKLVFATGLSDRWIGQFEEEPRMARVFEDLQLLLAHMQAYEHAAQNGNLAGYLEMFPEPPEIMTEELVGEEHGIALLTVHAAKGLEFDQVFIINNTLDSWGERGGAARQLPAELAPDSRELPPEHERRRLLYVAMTRARSHLTLSASLSSSSGRARKPSPFLEALFSAAELTAPVEQAGQKTLEASLQKLQHYQPKTLEYQGRRLPFENQEGWLELSPSDLENYERCPYDFYLAKVLKIRSPLGPQVAFGSLLHEVFRLYYQSRLNGEPVALSALEDYLDTHWRDHGYASPRAAAAARRQAEQTLKRFYKREEAQKRQLRSSEEKFRLLLPEAKLIIKGRIDATFITPAGLEIRDFKTGRPPSSTERLKAKVKTSPQLRTYALAMTEETGDPPAQVVLDYVVHGRVGAAQLSAQILKNHRQKLAKIAAAIRQHEFPPRATPVHRCTAFRYWGSEQASNE